MKLNTSFDQEFSYTEFAVMPFYGVAILSISTFLGILCAFQVKDSVYQWTMTYIDQVAGIWAELSLKHPWLISFDEKHGFVFLALNFSAALFSHIGILIGAAGIPILLLEISHWLVFHALQGVFMNEDRIRQTVNPIVAQAISRGLSIGFFAGIMIFVAGFFLIGDPNGNSLYYRFLVHNPYITYLLYIPFSLPFVALIFHKHVYVEKFPAESGSIFFGTEHTDKEVNDDEKAE